MPHIAAPLLTLTLPTVRPYAEEALAPPQACPKKELIQQGDVAIHIWLLQQPTLDLSARAHTPRSRASKTLRSMLSAFELRLQIAIQWGRSICSGLAALTQPLAVEQILSSKFLCPM